MNEKFEIEDEFEILKLDFRPVNIAEFKRNSDQGQEREVTRVARIEGFYSDCLLVLLPSLSIILCFSQLSCQGPPRRERGQSQRINQGDGSTDC